MFDFLLLALSIATLHCPPQLELAQQTCDKPCNRAVFFRARMASVRPCKPSKLQEKRTETSKPRKEKHRTAGLNMSDQANTKENVLNLSDANPQVRMKAKHMY